MALNRLVLWMPEVWFIRLGRPVVSLVLDIIGFNQS